MPVNPNFLHARLHVLFDHLVGEATFTIDFDRAIVGLPFTIGGRSILDAALDELA